MAAVVAERDDLRTRLAAYESASVEASAETLAALRRMDAAAEHAGRGSCEPLLSAETAAAIREHLRWLTTRYQREHVGRERAEMQRDVARTERDVLEMQLADQRAAAREARSQRDLAMTWGAEMTAEARSFEECWRLLMRAMPQLTSDRHEAFVQRNEAFVQRNAALERGVRAALSWAAQAYRDGLMPGDIEAADASVVVARERETAELGDPGGTALAAGPAPATCPLRAQETAEEAPHRVGDAWEYTEGASLHRGPFIVESVEGDGVTRPVQIRMSGIVGARIPAMMRASGWRRVIIAAARERETEPLTDEGGAYCLACEGCGECPMTARLCTKCWGTGSAAEQPRADLGETDAGEGE
ncbi:MAG TPA: hypothetical protein VM513_28145 [Kofleriaceae bacterium]|nr:hypothetical protein [Kofleriaceae bacterium]